MFSHDTDIGERRAICDAHGFRSVFSRGRFATVRGNIAELSVDLENGVVDSSVPKSYWCEDKGRDRVD